MSAFPFVADRRFVLDAERLIAQFGEDAGFEAAARADASRDRGNVPHYCRWRQIERMIIALSDTHPHGALH